MPIARNSTPNAANGASTANAMKSSARRFRQSGPSTNSARTGPASARPKAPTTSRIQGTSRDGCAILAHSFVGSRLTPKLSCGRHLDREDGARARYGLERRLPLLLSAVARQLQRHVRLSRHGISLRRGAGLRRIQWEDVDLVATSAYLNREAIVSRRRTAVEKHPIPAVNRFGRPD